MLHQIKINSLVLLFVAIFLVNMPCAKAEDLQAKAEIAAAQTNINSLSPLLLRLTLQNVGTKELSL